MKTDQFKKDLEELQITVTDVQFEQFVTYYELLIEKIGRAHV